MANTLLTLTQVEDLFQALTSTFLNTTDPGAVRIGWPADGAPAWEISYDVAFLLVNYEDREIAKFFEREYVDNNSSTVFEKVSNIMPLRVEWTLYGPNAFDNAALIRNNLATASTISTLMQSNIGLVKDIPMPTRVPELYNGQWWNRATFYAEFNQLTVLQSTVPYLLTADVQTEEG